MASGMRLAIVPASTDYLIILRSRDSGVSKDEGLDATARPAWFAWRCEASSAGALARLLTMRIQQKKFQRED
jgi:hypothetical protein